MTTTSRSLAERQERKNMRQAHVCEAASLAVNHVLESVSRERKFAKHVICFYTRYNERIRDKRCFLLSKELFLLSTEIELIINK